MGKEYNCSPLSRRLWEWTKYELIPHKRLRGRLLLGRSKTIPDRVSAHTQERLWWRDFCDGVKNIQYSINIYM